MNKDILELLVNAERLKNAITNDDDMRLLIENEDLIGRWADYEDKLREVVTSRTIDDFNSVMKYLQEEKEFLEKRKSSKSNMVDTQIQKLKKVHQEFVYAFMHWYKEINKYRNNELLDEMTIKVGELDNLLKAEKSKVVLAAAQKFDIREGLSLLGLDEVDPHTFKFIKLHKDEFERINPGAIKNTDKYLKKYKKEHNKYPDNVKQLKEYIK